MAAARKRSTKSEDTDRKRLLERRDEAIEAINKDLKYRASGIYSDGPLSEARWIIPTGIRILDEALGGGMYEGKYMKWYGPPGAGKTTLLMIMMLRVMARGGFCVWADPEFTFDKIRVLQLAEAMGVTWDEDLFIFIEPHHLEHLFASTYQAMQTVHPVPKAYSKRPEFKEPMGVFYDTISACPTDWEFEQARTGKKPKSGMTARPRRIHEHMRKLGPLAALHGAVVATAEQSIEAIGSYFPTLTTSGGHGTSFKSSQTFLMRPRGPIAPDGTIIGQWVDIKTEKTRFSKPRASFRLPFYYDSGFHNLESLCLLLKDEGAIRRYGGVYTLPAEEGQEELKFNEADMMSGALEEPVLQRLEAVFQEHKHVIWKGRAKASDSPDDD